MIRPITLAAMLFGLLSAAPAPAQLKGARELTTLAPVKGAPASKPVPDLYYLAGETGAKETFTLTIKGPASLTLFSPDGHEMVSATGSGKVTLTAYLNLTDVFTLAVSRVNPAQAYTLSRQSRLPTLAEASGFSNIGYTIKGPNGDFAQCWITPGVKYRATTTSRITEYTLAADRETVTGVARESGKTWSFDYKLTLAGNTMKKTVHFPDGQIKDSTADFHRTSLGDGRVREFTGYLCPK